MMEKMNTGLIPALNNSLDIDLAETLSYKQIKEKLIQHINYLIQKDFQKLILILYRVDVNEENLKLLLRENPEKEAASIISDLIIERQLQKIKTRQKHHRDNDIHEEEKW